MRTASPAKAGHRAFAVRRLDIGSLPCNLQGTEQDQVAVAQQKQDVLPRCRCA